MTTEISTSPATSPTPRRRGPAKTKGPERPLAKVEKRRPALSDKEVARIAVDLFNGVTTMTKTAKALGISTSYLSRLIKGAEKRGAFHYAVARD